MEAATVTRVSGFEIREAPTTEGRELAVTSPAAKSREAALDKLLAVGSRIGARHARREPVFDGALQATAACTALAAGWLTMEGVRLGRPMGFFYGAAVLLTGAAALIPVAEKKLAGVSANRTDLRSIDFRVPLIGERPAMETAILREAARRGGSMASILERPRDWQARSALASPTLAPESERALTTAFAALFGDADLAPRKDLLGNAEALVFALETCAEADRPVLASFIAKVLAASGTVPDSGTVEGNRYAMLRAALEVKSFTFTSLAESLPAGEVSAEGQRVSDLAYAEAQFTLAHCRQLQPDAPAWGRGYCESLEDAIRVAARLERAGLKASIGSHAQPGKPSVSVIAYESGKDPGLFLHQRNPVGSVVPRADDGLDILRRGTRLAAWTLVGAGAFYALQGVVGGLTGGMNWGPILGRTAANWQQAIPAMFAGSLFAGFGGLLLKMTKKERAR